MVGYKKKWKEISYEEYKKLIKNKSDIEIAFMDISKELNYSRLIPNNGEGLLNYIHKYEEENRKEHSPEDYKYYKGDGYETVITTGSKGVEILDKIFNNGK